VDTDVKGIHLLRLNALALSGVVDDMEQAAERRTVYTARRHCRLNGKVQRLLSVVDGNQ